LEITIATRNGRALEHASTRAILSARVVIPFGYTLTIGLKPQRLAADAAYESGLMIGWLMRHGIEPHFPPVDQSPAICHNTRCATHAVSFAVSLDFCNTARRAASPGIGDLIMPIGDFASSL
jgi:hypothetical protein